MAKHVKKGDMVEIITGEHKGSTGKVMKINPVKKKQVEHFIEVIIRDGVDQGVLLATSGYTDGAFDAVSKFKKVKLHLGDRSQIYTLCSTLVRHDAGLWSKPEDMSVVLTNSH